MRRFLLSSTFLLLAACATRPQGVQPQPQQPRPPVSEHTHGPIIGLTSQELVQLLGTPALQIREGASLKLQFRSRFCVLDAYLYPPPGAAAPLRVGYVDTRSRALAAVDQGACLHSLEGP